MLETTSASCHSLWASWRYKSFEINALKKLLESGTTFPSKNFEFSKRKLLKFELWTFELKSSTKEARISKVGKQDNKSFELWMKREGRCLQTTFKLVLIFSSRHDSVHSEILCGKSSTIARTFWLKQIDQLESFKDRLISLGGPG